MKEKEIKRKKKRERKGKREKILELPLSLFLLLSTRRSYFQKRYQRSRDVYISFSRRLHFSFILSWLCTLVEWIFVKCTLPILSISISTSIYLYLYLYFYLSTYISIYLPIYLSIYLPLLYDTTQIVNIRN